MSEKPKFRKGSKKSLDDFAKGVNEEEAGRPGDEELSDTDNSADEMLPWEHPDVRDEKRMVSLYIPEKTRAMLKYISEKTGVPQQRFMRDVLVPAAEREANRIAAAEKRSRKDE